MSGAGAKEKSFRANRASRIVVSGQEDLMFCVNVIMSHDQIMIRKVISYRIVSFSTPGPSHFNLIKDSNSASL